MKSILFIAFLALATIGCDTPEKSTNSDTSAPPMSDTSATMPTDTSSTTPVDTTSSPTSPTDTTTTR